LEQPLVITIALIVLLLLGGGLALLSRQRVLPWSLPVLKTSGGANPTDHELGATGARNQTQDGIDESAFLKPTAVVRSTTMDVRSSLPAEERPMPLDSVRVDLFPTQPDALDTRLDQFEERLEEIARAVDRQAAEIGQEVRRARSELAHRAEADDARRDVAIERMRADLLAALTRAVAEGGSRSGGRRPEVSADLYARLARLEAALAAVTNPILLPGEAYAPPAEFLPEALIWENWNEVGERAFSLADAYSAQRLHLSRQTRDEVDVFVTTLRILLTRSVYPNLQLEPDAAQQTALRAALDEIATELPKVRQTLEWEYQEGRTS
jgi:hypothetical protein